MDAGVKYRVTFLDRSGGKAAMKEFVGVFLEENREGHRYFSLRPTAGTTVIGKTEFVSAVPTDEAVSLPRRVIA